MPHNLTSRQNLAASALAAGKDVMQAAEVAGVARETVSRWKGQAAFRDEVARLEDEAAALATRRLSALLDRSVDELERLLLTSEMPVSEKIRVINLIFNHYTRFAEIKRIDERLAEIERVLSHET